MMRIFSLAAALLALTVACDSPGIGESCEVTGDGFTRKDPCEHTCVEWDVQCPSGELVTPGVCSGAQCETDAQCGGDFLCLPINMTDSACIPASFCGNSTSELDAPPPVSFDPEEALSAE